MKSPNLYAFTMLILLSSCGREKPHNNNEVLTTYLSHAEVIENSVQPKIVRVNTKYSICTGSLLHPRIVLTAAHCFNHLEGIANIDFAIKLNNKASTQKINIKNIIIHNNYNGESDSESDLAILILDTPAIIPSGNYMKLAKDFSSLEVGDEVHLVGFGLDENNFNSGIKRKKTIKRLKSYMCNASDDYIRLEVGAKGGDSGGPVMINDNNNEQVQIGVLASQTIGFMGMCHGTNFVDMSLYTDWLFDKTGYEPTLSIQEIQNSLISKKLL